MTRRTIARGSLLVVWALPLLAGCLAFQQSSLWKTQQARSAQLLHQPAGLVPTVVKSRTRTPGNGDDYFGNIIPRSTLALSMAKSSREEEIRRKITQLKRQGKINTNNNNNNPSEDDGTSSSLASYQSKVREKLGAKKSSLLGIGDDLDVANLEAELDSLGDDDDDDDGSLQPDFDREILVSEQPGDLATTVTPSTARSDATKQGKELSEEELLELVAAKLERNQRLQASSSSSSPLRTPQFDASTTTTTTPASSEPTSTNQLTTGVGGSWQRDETGTDTQDLYKPKTGSWGAFPRPKDISKAYGGGRRVGAGFSKEGELDSDLNTQNLLKEYRRKVGIDVPTEKEHAAEIQEALQIGQLAMQRGLYPTAVSALEKVTKWCSTNSPVGSKVFLELAMAYEATGRTKEAYQVYKTLTTCRMEDVKFNAKRLLYGLEAMEFMRDLSSDFSRQKIKNTFIDTTGLANIAQNFDNVYQTAYVDLDNGYYKRLTESIVRSNREARQILLKATGKGEVGRLKVVQALRSLARHFDEALERETLQSKTVEPTAFINGKPLLVEPPQDNGAPIAGSLDDFVLASPEQMMQNLEGSWRLQLLADKQGDGVSFFNTSLAIQKFSTEKMTFSASGPSGFVKVQCSGQLRLEDSQRIISKNDMTVESGVGNLLGIFGSTKNSGFLAAVSRSQQIICVDSILLVTKSPSGARTGKDADKEHFAVWRRIGEEDKIS